MPLHDAEPQAAPAPPGRRAGAHRFAHAAGPDPHPVSIALIEALLLGGAMTATEVGERIGESPTTCSLPAFRQLAKHGFVEEAGAGGRAGPGRGGRARSGCSSPARTTTRKPRSRRVPWSACSASASSGGTGPGWKRTGTTHANGGTRQAAARASCISPPGNSKSSARKCWPWCCPVPRAAHRSRPPPAGRGAGGDPHAGLPDSACPRPVTSRPMRLRQWYQRANKNGVTSVRLPGGGPEPSRREVT